MNKDDLQQRILAHVLESNYRPVKPRVIAKQLKLPEEQYQDVKRLIQKMAKSGRLGYGANHLVEAPTSKSAGPAQQLTGVFRRNPGGFGFVRPHGVHGSEERESDVFVAAADAGDASTGDVVLVRVLKKRGRFGGLCGAVIEVLERDTHRFVGTYFEGAGGAFVQVDGTLFAQPVWVGDPGAKNAQPDDKVVLEMVRFPTHLRDGEGVIVEVLGPRNAPGVDALSIIREFNLPEEFDEKVLQAARNQADAFEESIPDDRLDLTGLTVITIDPADARDFDDAISLERMDNGHWLLGVHIADVSHFVRPGTPLDQEAHRRGTSVYLPDRVIPMLPEIISNGLASLQPNRVRFTKSAFLEFTAEGVSVACDLHSAAIKSDKRLDYGQVDQFLNDPEAWRNKLTAKVHGLLGRMRELAAILRQRRTRRGALELAIDEVKVDLDKHGRVTGAHLVENTESHKIIEEFMLSANEAVAEKLHQADLLFLRRVHMAPDPRKLKMLTEFVASLGYKTKSLESRFELQNLLGRVAGQPQQHAVNFAVLRSLQRASYSPEEQGHFALASDCYCHFTSPIRRYPDLSVHRLVDGLLNKKKPFHDFGELVVLGEHCSERERRAEAAERELTRVKLLNYLSQRIGDEMDAVITGVESFGLFAQGVELPAEGLIHISSLQDDYYHYDKNTHSLSGRRAGNTFRLGDRVCVTVVAVDVDRRQLDFRLVQRRARPMRKAKSPEKPQLPAPERKKKKPKATAAAGRAPKPPKKKTKARGRPVGVKKKNAKRAKKHRQR